MSDPGRVAAAFERACLAEIRALKPGNVHIHADGHGMVVAQFERAARASAAVIALPGIGVGERIELAVQASLAAAGCNTNLGIVLLAAPLVEAALDRSPQPLRARLHDVLADLTVADASACFRAIAMARPGGLGQTSEHDVHGTPQVTLLEAMRAAAERDRIALQYVTDFRDVFEIGVGRIERSGHLESEAVVEAVHLDFMSRLPDTHIFRKFGSVTAEGVQAEAANLAGSIDWASSDRRVALLSFDQSLKARGLNPGTSADLTVASLLAADLSATP